MTKKLNDIIDVKFIMELIGSISSLGFNVQFEPEYLEFQNITKNGVFDFEIIKLNESNSSVINVGLVEQDEYISNISTHLANVEFKAIKKGVTNIVFMPENREILKDGEPADIEQEWNDGVLEIEPGDKIVMTIVIE